MPICNRCMQEVGTDGILRDGLWVCQQCDHGEKPPAPRDKVGSTGTTTTDANSKKDGTLVCRQGDLREMPPPAARDKAGSTGILTIIGIIPVAALLLWVFFLHPVISVLVGLSPAFLLALYSCFGTGGDESTYAATLKSHICKVYRGILLWPAGVISAAIAFVLIRPFSWVSQKKGPVTGNDYSNSSALFLCGLLLFVFCLITYGAYRDYADRASQPHGGPCGRCGGQGYWREKYYTEATESEVAKAKEEAKEKYRHVEPFISNPNALDALDRLADRDFGAQYKTVGCRECGGTGRVQPPSPLYVLPLLLGVAVIVVGLLLSLGVIKLKKNSIWHRPG